MKNSFLIFSLGFIAICLTIGCSKNSSNVEDSNQFKEEIAKYKQVGIKHNEAVYYVLNNTPEMTEMPEKDFLLSHINSLLPDVLPTEFQLYEEDGSRLIDNSILGILYDDDGTDIIDHIQEFNISNELEILLNEMGTSILKNLSVEDLNKELEKVERKAITTLDDSDLPILLSATSVARYSSRLWNPTNLGGENGIKHLVPSQNSANVRFSSCAAIIGADAVAAVAGATNAVISSGGTAAIPNPALGGMPTAGAAAIVTGAAGSVTMAIGKALK